MAESIRLEAGERDCWAVVFMAHDGERALLGTTPTLAAARDVADAWWSLRAEIGRGIHFEDCVVVAVIEDGTSDPELWHARLDFEGWQGVAL